jgi:DNA-directed RNA polymerase subunit beta'
VSQDVIINDHDCQSKAGLRINKEESVKLGETFRERLLGRALVKNVVVKETGEILVEAAKLMTEADYEALEKAGIEEVIVRSPLHCQIENVFCSI